jgi:hypothetical protein
VARPRSRPCVSTNSPHPLNSYHLKNPPPLFYVGPHGTKLSNRDRFSTRVAWPEATRSRSSTLEPVRQHSLLPLHAPARSLICPCNAFATDNATVNAKQGDLGTHVLKPRPSGTVWKRGSVARARWELTAAHGGGFQYRICPANETLNEACFSKTPLSFARGPAGKYTHLVIMKDEKDNYEIPATVVDTGGGIGWAVHPMGAADAHPCDWVSRAFN